MLLSSYDNIILIVEIYDTHLKCIMHVKYCVLLLTALQQAYSLVKQYLHICLCVC